MVPFVVTDGIILERILSGHIIKKKETKKNLLFQELNVISDFLLRMIY